MSSGKKCQGTNRRDEPCGNAPQSDSLCCRYHQSSSNPEQFNKDCPACLSADGDFYLMPCMHRMHLECATHMTAMECPLCRASVNNFPRNIQESIASNEQSYQQDLEDEDRQNLQTREREVREMVGDMSLYVSPPAQVEAIAAMQFLRNEGIPLSYLPTNIQISLPRDSPQPPAGTLFYAILGHVMEKIDQDIQSGDIIGEIQPEPYETEGDGSDEENPFEWEDENLAILSRSVRVDT